MNKNFRNQFNQEFSNEKYHKFLESINKDKMFKKSYSIDYHCMFFHKSGDSK